MYTKIVVSKNVIITDKEIKNYSFSHPNIRTMDVFTQKIIFTAHKLLKNGFENINSEKTGAVISTRKGAGSSLKEISKIINDKGYIGINPSLFPNVMLSTGLSYLTAYLKIHGPSCVFYDDKNGKDALGYCEIQLNTGKCEAVVMVCAYESGSSEGKFIIRKESTDENRIN